MTSHPQADLIRDAARAALVDVDNGRLLCAECVCSRADDVLGESDDGETVIVRNVIANLLDAGWTVNRPSPP